MNMKYILLHKGRLAGFFEATQGTLINGDILGITRAYFSAHGSSIIKNVNAPTEIIEFQINIRKNINDVYETKTFTLKPVLKHQSCQP